MLKILFGSWIAIWLIPPLLLFVGGLYLAAHPGFDTELSPEGLYLASAIMLVLWIFIAAAWKKNS